jgi:hypothetical protein
MDNQTEKKSSGRWWVLIAIALVLLGIILFSQKTGSKPFIYQLF